MALTYFPVTADYTATNGTPVNATVYFQPQITPGDLIHLTDQTPNLGLIAAPTIGKIVNGILTSTSGGNLQLVSGTADLNLTAPLTYRVTFYNVTTGTEHTTLNPFAFTAPPDTTPVNLVDVTPSATALVTRSGIVSTDIQDATVVGREILTAATTAAVTELLDISGGPTLPEDGTGTTFFDDQGNFVAPVGAHITTTLTITEDGQTVELPLSVDQAFSALFGQVQNIASLATQYTIQSFTSMPGLAGVTSGEVINSTATSPTSLTLDLDANTGIPAGNHWYIIQTASGTVTLAPVEGVNLVTFGNKTALAGVGALVGLMSLGNNTYFAWGDLA